MYDLYIANKNYSSWSLRPWILLRQLNVPFAEHLETFNTGLGSNWDEFRRFSPTGKVPCLHADGQVVWDSLAISEFIAEHFPKAWPMDNAARAWARSASAEMHSGFSVLREECSMNCSIRVRPHAISPALQKDIVRVQELWCEGLATFGGPFLAGAEFTAVDAFYCPIAIRVQTYGLQLNNTAAAYAKRLLELPAMQDWFISASQEPVEPEHEENCLKYGVLISDRR